MKACLLLAVLFVTTLAQAKVFFHPLTDLTTSHELTWNFSKAVSGWGKTDRDQVFITCDGNELAKEPKVYWSNAQTLKLVPAANFNPGAKCETQLNLGNEKQKDTFSVPLAKVIDQRPYSYDNLSEDAVIVLVLDAQVDEDSLANQAFMEVEGMREKVEYDAVKGDLKKEILTAAYLDKNTASVVLKPRRRYPYGKKVVFSIPQKSVYAFKLEGKVREDFKLTMNCERANADEPCSPVSRIRLNFNEDVKVKHFDQIKLRKGKKTWDMSETTASNLSYGDFPTVLEPNSEYVIEIDGDIRDLDGRELSNRSKFPLTFRTGHYPPLAKFPGAFGILEANADPIVPVSIRNVEKEVVLHKTSTVLSLNNPKIFAQWLQSIDRRQDVGYTEVELRAVSVFKGSPIATKKEVLKYTAGKNDIEVLGLPVKQKGLHLLELSSPILAKSLLKNQNVFYISSAILVTNMVVHLKVAENETLAWVTTLDKAEVVADAHVSLYNCKAELLDSGKTGAKGFVILSKASKKHLSCYDGLEKLNGKILAVAKTVDDATFTLSSWQEGIEPWRFGMPYYMDSTEFNKAHTVFDRPLYKVKEKVHMLHLLRVQGDDGLIYSKEKYSHLRVYHEETQKEWLSPLSWKDFGSAVSEFVVPENAPQGNYTVTFVNLNDKKEVTDSIWSGQFLVKDFRVPLMRSEFHLQDRQESYIQGQSMKALGHLEYLAGGPSGSTPVTLRGELNSLWGTSIEEYPTHRFDFSGITRNENTETTVLEKKLTRTDKKGDFSFELKDLPKSSRVQSLFLEIEYLDPNGVYQTNSTQTKIYPYEKLIGIKTPEYVKSKRKARFDVVVINHKKIPQKKVEFKGTLYKQNHISTRKKIIGGFYTYDSSTKTDKIGEVCSGTTNIKGEAPCEFKVDSSGYYFLIVESSDSLGTTSFNAYGNEMSWTPQEYHDRVDLIPGEKVYHPGDVAKIAMNLPFEKATVLVTKERAGIKEAYLTPYDRTNPFLTIPIEKNDYPNFFISAFAVRGRIGTPAPTGLVDLAKPAYRMGLQEIKVDRNDHHLKIVITPEKEKYQVRDQVKVKVKVSSLDGSPLGSARVALSVFDEGLLLLNGQSSFDAARALIKPYSHGVSTSTAQTHIIGKRHFGLKARPHGGGGGKDLRPRELFDTLIYWNPSVTLDKNGEAMVTFKLNDSLTSFKIYGLAYSQERFGTQNSRIMASQDIMTFTGTSPEVRTGDEFSASYTLKNISANDKTVRIELFNNQQKIKEETLTVKAGESAVLSYPMTPFQKEGQAVYLLNIYDGIKKIDAIKTFQKISPLMLPRVRFSDLKEVKGPVTIAGLTTDKQLFGTEILLSAGLTPSLKSLQDYMRTYPYSCLEQKLAKATIMEDKDLLAKVDRELTSYIDGRGFLKYYPTGESRGSLHLTTHFLEVNAWNGVTTSKDKALQLTLANFANGYIKDLTDWEQKDFKALKIRAMVALKLTKYDQIAPAWINEITPPAPEDNLITLMDKWVLFSPGEKSKAALDIIQTKLKVDGSLVSLVGENYPSNWFLYSFDSTVFGRLLLLMKTLPAEGEFAEFYHANEGKFIRGYFKSRIDGHFGGTTSNTYAYLLRKKWSIREPVTGATSVAGLKSDWKNATAPSLFLNRELAEKDQSLEHKGTGAPWADVRTMSYPDPKASTAQGIDVKVEINNLESHATFEVQDRVEAKISLKVKNNVTMGAINLALPSGVTVLESTSTTGLDFEERTESKWRGYINDLPKGDYEIRVIFRLNQAGKFEVPGARVEAMYSPDLFGESPFWTMKVK